MTVETLVLRLLSSMMGNSLTNHNKHDLFTTNQYNVALANARVFSCAWHRLHTCASSSDWLIPAFVVIGQIRMLWVWVPTVIRKPLWACADKSPLPKERTTYAVIGKEEHWMKLCKLPWLNILLYIPVLYKTNSGHEDRLIWVKTVTKENYFYCHYLSNDINILSNI